jgi:hypothetical protein
MVDFVPALKWDVAAAAQLPEQPATTAADISVVGSGDRKGVYYFGNDYMLYRYPLHYETDAVPVTSLTGYFGYSQLDLYGAASTLGRFDLTQNGQFVCSTISNAPSPVFLGGLKRDYAFFFNEYYNTSGQLPVQIALPNPSNGYFWMVDVAANTTNVNHDGKVYWVQVDDPDESSPPSSKISVILGVYQFGFSGNTFTGDIHYLSGSVAPMGDGDGLIDIKSLRRFAVDGDPQGVVGSTDLIGWFLETDPPALECFSIVSGDASGNLNKSLCTIKNFQGTPRDISVFPAHTGGYGQRNWVVVLEELTGEWTIEVFDQTGQKINITSPDSPAFPITGYPANMDIDPAGYEVHVWSSLGPGGPLYAIVFGITVG